MNIEFAKTIPMPEILGKIGYEPVNKRGDQYEYISPLRDEKTPSFNVNIKLNKWFDFAENFGGDPVTFACAYLKASGNSHQVPDGLRWLRNMMGYSFSIKPVPVEDYSKEDGALKLKSAHAIKLPALREYIEGRRIPFEIARRYLKEVRVFNAKSGKSFSALGIMNEDGGFELRNQFFKGGLKPKTITFIRGKKPKPDGVNIFEGMFDFLSAVADQDGDNFDDDSIILNSLSCMKDATAYIRGYGYLFAYTWLDNDEAGDKARASFAEFFKTEENLQHKPMNHLYDGHKDVNAWRIARLAPAA